MHEISRVIKPQDISHVVLLAHKIWNQHFVPIIGQGQVDYMLARFQSLEAITEQIAEGYGYYLLLFHGSPVGYIAIRPNHPNGKMMISKIYVDPDTRGTGHGQYLLDFVKEQAVERGLSTIWLTVNKGNELAINWYRKRGFVVVKEVTEDIGGGFYMDDFLMEKVLD